MKKQNKKTETINKIKAKRLAGIICLSFFTACCIAAMIVVFILCIK